MLERIKIANRITLALGVVLLLVGLVGAGGLWGVWRMTDGVDQLRKLDAMTEVVGTARLGLAAYEKQPTSQTAAAAKEGLESLRSVLSESDDPELMSKLAQLEAGFKALTEADGSVEAASKEIQAQLASAIAAFDAAADALAKSADAMVKEADELVRHAEDTEHEAALSSQLSVESLEFQRDANRYAVTRDERDGERLFYSQQKLHGTVDAILKSDSAEGPVKKRIEQLARMDKVVGGVLKLWRKLILLEDTPPARLAAAEVRLLRGAAEIEKIATFMQSVQSEAASVATAKAEMLGRKVAEAQELAGRIRLMAVEAESLDDATALYIARRDWDMADQLMMRTGLLTAGARDTGSEEGLKAAQALSGFAPQIEQTRAAFQERDVAAQSLNTSLDALDARFGEGAAAVKAEIAETSELSSMAMVVIIAVGVLLGVSLGWVIAASIRRQLGVLGMEMREMAAGELDRPLPNFAAGTEPAEMGAALKVFQENGQRVRQMAAEKEEADAAAAAERQRMMAELQSEFGTVVDSALEGDFTNRVDANFPDAELNQLADGVNRLLETVESGLSETGRVLGNVAEGVLTERMEGDFRGAFADLQHSLNGTVGRLSGLVEEIAGMSRQIESSADEMTTGAEALSGRAETQASSLEETAATMEEMSSSIKANAESSSSASELALDASKRADQGGEIVKNAVSAMSEIEQSASKIADIINVIDGIAFQTNLLALNAAVEAARAGEAGKGFAVVASEVRALAQRSADASRDIRELIEASATQVSSGVQLVTQTGQSLEGIMGSIIQVEEAVRNIATASVEQASGVEEISAAISHMDGMTQENSTMADHSAATARRLTEGARELQKLVGFFTIDASAAATAAALEQPKPEAAADADWAAAQKAAEDVVETEPQQKAWPAQQAASGDDWATF